MGAAMTERAEIPTAMVWHAKKQACSEIPLQSKLAWLDDERALAEVWLQRMTELSSYLCLFDDEEARVAIAVLRDRIGAVRDARTNDASEIRPYVSGAPRLLETWTAAILLDEFGRLAASVRAAWHIDYPDQGLAALVKSRSRDVKRAQVVRHEMLRACGKQPGCSNATPMTIMGRDVELGVTTKPAFVDELSQRRAARSAR